MSRQKILFAFVCALLCFSLEVANACSPAMPVARVTCMNGETDWVGTTWRNAPRPAPIDTTESINLAQSLCATDLSAGRTEINRIAKDYAATYRDFNVGALHLAPYSPERVTTLALQNLNLLTCEAYKYEVVEYWLISYNYTPDYCSGEMLSIPICGAPYHIELLPFLWFLVQNPTWSNSLYLVGIATGLWVVVRLWRQKRLGSVLAATPLAIVIFLVACPALLMLTLQSGFSLDIGTLGWALMVWVLAKGVNYVAVKIWRVWRKVETPV